MRRFAIRIGGATVVAVAAALSALPASAGDIIADWGTAKTPPAPELKSVTVDPKTTALLVLDLMKGNCGVRPRCQATVPNIKKMIDTAHAHNVAVLYNLTGRGSTVARMVDQSFAPRARETTSKDATRDAQF